MTFAGSTLRLFGVVPQSFSTDWALKPKVLAIVDDNATAIDARMPVGAIKLTKLHPTLSKIMAVKGELVRICAVSRLRLQERRRRQGA